MSIRADQLDTVASEFEGTGTDNRQLSIKAGGISEAKLGFSWETVDILASAFTYDGTRSNYTLTSAASSNGNVDENHELLRNGVGGMTRVTTTSASGEWSLSGTTLSVHGDVTATGDSYTIRYVVGTASGASSASGNQIWLGTLPQSPLDTTSDYFNDGLLDSKWLEWDPQTTLTVQETPDGLKLTRSGDVVRFNGLIQELPAHSTFAITAEVEIDVELGKLAGGGILVGEDLETNPTTDALWMVYVLWSTTESDWVVAFQRWTNYDGSATTHFQDRVGALGSRFLIRLYVDTGATTMQALISRDGRRWLSLGTEEDYSADTIDKMGFVTRNASGTDAVVYSRMFRVDATSDPYLPVGGFVGTSVPSTFTESRPLAVSGGNTLNEYGWNDRKAKLIKCEVFSAVLGTVGTYTFALTKDPGGTANNMPSHPTRPR
jgi:hypothetical protein